MVQTEGKVIETEQIMVRAKVIDILPGEHPAIIIVEQTCTPAGKVRPFTQKVAVPDASLFQKLLREIKKNDDIRATVVTTWYEDNYQTHLAHFSKADAASSGLQSAAPASAVS